MKLEQYLPTIMIILDMLAAGGYAYVGDIRKLIYWIAAAILTATVTF